MFSKKIVSIIAGVFMSGAVVAGEYAKFDFTPVMINDAGGNSSYVGGVSFGNAFDKNWFAEGKFGFGKEKNTNASSNTIGATVGYNVTDWAFVRGGLIHEYSSTNTFNSYTFGGGVSYPLTQQLSAVGSIDRTIAFDNARPSYNTYEAGVTYALDKKNEFGLSYVKNRKEVDSHGIKFGYKHSF